MESLPPRSSQRNPYAGRTAYLEKRLVALALWLLASSVFSRVHASEPSVASDAILINVTEQDLNRILQAAFRASGGPRFEGRRTKVSRGISDLRYQVELSEPVLKLGEDGRVWLNLRLQQADLRIERMERKIGHRTAYCENAGITVDPANPIDLELALELRATEGGLQIIPENVSVSDLKHVHLVRPSRCKNAPLPTWLLWWLGKGRLKRQLGKLGSILLARANDSAAKLDRKEGMQSRHWEINSLTGAGRKEDIGLFPQSLSTSPRSLFLSLACSSSDSRPVGPRSLEWVKPRSDRSFVAVSRTFLNSVLASAFSGSFDRPRKTHGDFSRLLDSSSIYTLIPGIRDLKAKKNVSFSLAFRSPPEIEFSSLSAIRVHFSGIEIGVFEKKGDQDAPLGMLQIESGTLGIVPFPNALGGVSFQIVENEWSVSSTGIEFNDPLFAATVQEMIFAEAFETQYAPLWKEGLRVGDTTLAPQRFSTVDDYLVIELAPVTIPSALKL